MVLHWIRAAASWFTLGHDPLRHRYLLLLIATFPALADAGEREVVTALEGARIVVLHAIPAHKVGLEVDATNGRQLDEAQFRRTMKMWGPAFLAGDTAKITRVIVGKKQVELYLGRGGYGTAESILEASGEVPPGHASDVRRRQIDQREEQLERLSRGKSDRWIDLERDALAMERDRLRQEDYAEDAQNRALEMRRMAPQWGSRIHLRFKREMPSSIATPEGLYEVLAEYVRPVAPSDSITAPAADPP